MEYEFVDVDLGGVKVEKARVQVAQIELSDDAFERSEGRLQLKSSDSVQDYIRAQLALAERINSNLLLFPELCVPVDLVEEIIEWSRGKNCIVVAGTHYEKDPSDNLDISVSPIIFGGVSFSQQKTSVAPVERSVLYGDGVKEGQRFPIFRNSPFGTFANFICSDYLNTSLKTRVLERNIDFASIVAFQRDSKHYHSRIDLDVEESRSGIYVAYCNARVEPLTDGESSIFAVIDRHLYGDAKQQHVSRPDYLNMICSFDNRNQKICDVDTNLKRPTLGRTYNTLPNIEVYRVSQFLNLENDGSSVPDASSALDGNFFGGSVLLFTKVKETLNKFRSELTARYELDGTVIDAHSLSDEFSVILSQSVFYENGSTVVFKADFKKTNIQRSELLSLLTIHTISVEHNSLDGVDPPIQFFSTSELRQALADTWVSIVPDRETLSKFLDDDSVYSAISNTLVGAFCSLAKFSVVVDFFDCSAMIFPPPGLAIDFETILRQSGYIHSVGHTIYSRNIKKTSVLEFQENLDRYLTSDEAKLENRMLPFCLYCNEIFDGFETPEEESDILEGIGELKFRAEKFFFGGLPIYSFRDSVLHDERFRGKVEFIRSGRDYRDQIANLDNRAPGTIWLFRDRRQSEDDSAFFVCYRQLFVNADPFLQADEDKPAWLGPFTLPQSLASAMLSITRPYFDLDARPVIVDPFLGSGTTLFEAFKMFDRPIFWGGDVNPACRQAVFDNAELISSGSGSIDELLQFIDPMIEGDGNATPIESFCELYEASIDRPSGLFSQDLRHSDKAAETFSKCRDFVYDVLSSEESEASRDSDMHRKARLLSSSSIQSIFEDLGGECTLIGRVLVYCYWKAILRNSSSFLEGRSRLPDKVFLELVEVSRFMKRIKSGVRTQDPVRAAEDEPVYLFSDGVRGSTAALSQYLQDCNERIVCGDNGELASFLSTVANNVREDGVDIIVTDPPYGFNTDHESTGQLLELYETFIRSIVRLVGNRTHLLICLPEQSHNGQVLPSYVTKSWFVPRLLQEAKSARVEVIEYSKVWPSTVNGGKPPYFWQSEKSLTRSVLHVILRRVSS